MPDEVKILTAKELQRSITDILWGKVSEDYSALEPKCVEIEASHAALALKVERLKEQREGLHQMLRDNLKIMDGGNLAAIKIGADILRDFFTEIDKVKLNS